MNILLLLFSITNVLSYLKLHLCLNNLGKTNIKISFGTDCNSINVYL